jgi:ferredoxin
VFHILARTKTSEPVSIEGSPVLSLLNTMLAAGFPIRHDCGGKALCGTCRVAVLSGKLSPRLEREATRLSAVQAASDERLACQAHAAGDVELETVVDFGGSAEYPMKPA